MTRITHQITINAPKERVWEILADLGAVKRYNPSVSDSYYNPGEERGIGASRHCDLKPFGSVEETIIEWHDGESYTLEIHDGTKVPPFKQALGTFSVRQNGAGTVASMTFEYRLKYGPIGILIDRLMVRSQFEKVVPAILRGLRDYAESHQAAA